MKTDIIKAMHKAHNIIISCETKEHIIAAENYISNFKEIYNNEEYINKLNQKLNERKEKIKYF